MFNNLCIRDKVCLHKIPDAYYKTKNENVWNYWRWEANWFQNFKFSDILVEIEQVFYVGNDFQMRTSGEREGKSIFENIFSKSFFLLCFLFIFFENFLSTFSVIRVLGKCEGRLCGCCYTMGMCFLFWRDFWKCLDWFLFCLCFIIWFSIKMFVLIKILSY